MAAGERVSNTAGSCDLLSMLAVFEGAREEEPTVSGVVVWIVVFADVLYDRSLRIVLED